MKYTILLLTLLPVLFTACTQREENQYDAKTESVLSESDSAIQNSERHKEKLDSVITVVVEQTQKNLTELDSQVASYQGELKKVRMTTKEKIVYHTDTVYIETKKNFWGKEKTKVKVLSDTSITETEATDSTD